MNLKMINALMLERKLTNAKIAVGLKMQRSVMTHLLKGRVHVTDNAVEVGLEETFGVPRGTLRNSTEIPRPLTKLKFSASKTLKLYALAEVLGFKLKKMTDKDWLFVEDLANGVMDRRDEFINGRSWDHSAVTSEAEGG